MLTCYPILFHSKYLNRLIIHFLNANEKNATTVTTSDAAIAWIAWFTKHIFHICFLLWWAFPYLKIRLIISPSKIRILGLLAITNWFSFFWECIEHYLETLKFLPSPAKIPPVVLHWQPDSQMYKGSRWVIFSCVNFLERILPIICIQSIFSPFQWLGIFFCILIIFSSFTHKFGSLKKIRLFQTLSPARRPCWSIYLCT